MKIIVICFLKLDLSPNVSGKEVFSAGYIPFNF
jgi:hypothetical protein